MNKYSVINTKVTKTKKQIIKIYKKNTDIGISTNELLDLIKNYTKSIINSKIPFPKNYSFQVKNEKILVKMDYCGKNLFDLGMSPQNIFNYEKNITEILKILNIASKKNIMIDPHPKNFVFDSNNKVKFVDIYPPYSSSYNNIRIKKCTKKELDIVKSNFKLFAKKNISPHFVGDLVKHNKEYSYLLPFFYLLLKKYNEYNNSYSNFEKKIYEIVDIEIKRIKNKIFLI